MSKIKMKYAKAFFSNLFIFLLFLAEIGSSHPFFSPARSAGCARSADTIRSIACIRKSGLRVNSGTAVFLQGAVRSIPYDIETNKNLENLNNRVLSIREAFHAYRQSRRIGHSVFSFFEILKLFFTMWIRCIRVFFLLGTAFTYSLKFIIRYIHYKNGEKIKRFLSNHVSVFDFRRDKLYRN